MSWHASSEHACERALRVAEGFKNDIVDTGYDSLFLAAFSAAQNLGIPLLHLCNVSLEALDSATKSEDAIEQIAVADDRRMPLEYRRTHAFHTFAQARAIVDIARAVIAGEPLHLAHTRLEATTSLRAARLIAARYEGVVGWVDERVKATSGTAQLTECGWIRTKTRHPKTARPDGHRGAYRFVGQTRFKTIWVCCPDDPWLDAAFREQIAERSRKEVAASRAAPAASAT